MGLQGALVFARPEVRAASRRGPPSDPADPLQGGAGGGVGHRRSLHALPHGEERAFWRASRTMASAAILRDARESALLRMRPADVARSTPCRQNPLGLKY